MLSEPLPIIERGKYGMDKEIIWLKKGNKKTRKRTNAKPDDAISWYETFLEDNKKISKDGEKSIGKGIHVCTREFRGNRCSICGMILDKNFNLNSDINAVLFNYSNPITNFDEVKGLNYQNILKPASSHDMRDYLLSIMGTKLKSLNDVMHANKTVPQSLSRYLTFRTQKEIRGEELPRFDSNFESGNLAKIYCIGEDEFDLFLSVDTNTKGYTQWFFFSVSVTDPLGKITFNIKNCCKSDSGYCNGMKPTIYSVKKQKATGIGWHVGGEEVSYTQNNLKREIFVYHKDKEGNEDSDDEIDDDFAKESMKNSMIGEKVIESMTLEPKIKRKKYFYYTLSFSYNFEYENDKVYFAYMKPYTFTDLVTLLLKLEKSLGEEQILMKRASLGTEKLDMNEFKPVELNTNEILYKREKIGQTISGIPLYMITITGNDDPAKIKKRKGIFLTARVHPGEANSSFVMQGILKFLLEDNQHAKILRSLYVFKIIPMLNPEGVACGNNRTNTSGADLNRRWHDPNEKLHPTIFAAKQAVAEFKKEREISIFCDIHGHSMKKNAFVYGCNTAADGGFCSWTKVRLFPRILAKKTPVFSLKDCSFRVTNDKLGTARVTIWKELKVTNSFTLEVSLFGYDYGDQVVPFTEQSLEKLGNDFLLSLVEYTYVLVELNKELAITGGWLKPSKLIQVTGTPAQQLLDKKLKEEKEEKRKLEIRENLNRALNISNVGKKKKVTRKAKTKKIRSVKQIPSVNDSLNENSFVENKKKSAMQMNNKKGYIDEEMDYMQKVNQTFDNDMTAATTNCDLRGYTTGDDSENECRTYLPTEPSLKTSIKRDNNLIINTFEDEQMPNLFSSVIQDWREYFKTEELDENYNMIIQGKDPNDLEKDEVESDSDGSDFGLEKEVFEQIKNSNVSNAPVRKGLPKFPLRSSSKTPIPSHPADRPHSLAPLSFKFRSPVKANKYIKTETQENTTIDSLTYKEKNNYEITLRTEPTKNSVLKTKDKNMMDDLLVIRTTADPSVRGQNKFTGDFRLPQPPFGVNRRNLSDSTRNANLEEYSLSKRGDSLAPSLRDSRLSRKQDGDEILRRRRALNEISQDEQVNPNSVYNPNPQLYILLRNDVYSDLKLQEKVNLRALPTKPNYTPSTDTMANYNRKAAAFLRPKNGPNF